MKNPIFDELCTIHELDQISGAPSPVATNLICTPPYPYIFRQTRAQTAYDFQPMQIFTGIPAGGMDTIKEGMRMVFADGQNFRIHSINGWPMVDPRFLEIILQSEGT